MQVFLRAPLHQTFLKFYQNFMYFFKSWIDLLSKLFFWACKICIGFKSQLKKIIILLRVSYIDKVYIVGSCGAKTLAGGLLACAF